MEKLKRVHVVGGAVGIALVIAAGIYFGLIKGTNEEITKVEGEITSAMQAMDTTAGLEDDVDTVFKRAVDKAKQELVAAEADFKLAQLQFQEFRRRYRHVTFRTNQGTMTDVWPQLVEEYHNRLIPDFMAFVTSLDCQLTQSLNIGEPPTPPIPFPASALLPIPDSSGGGGAMNAGMMGGMGGMMGGMGGMSGGFGGGGSGTLTVSVRGTFESVSTLIRRLPSFSRLCIMTGPPTLRNMDPVTETVEASFPIQFYLIADAPPSVLETALASAGQAAAGGMGGMGGGMGMSGAGAGMPGMPGDGGATAGTPGAAAGGSGS